MGENIGILQKAQLELLVGEAIEFDLVDVLFERFEAEPPQEYEQVRIVYHEAAL